MSGYEKLTANARHTPLLTTLTTNRSGIKVPFHVHGANLGFDLKTDFLLYDLITPRHVESDCQKPVIISVS